MVIVADVKTEAGRYAVRMNIAVSRVFGALRVVVPRRELEKDENLKRIAELAEAKVKRVIKPLDHHDPLSDARACAKIVIQAIKAGVFPESY